MTVREYINHEFSYKTLLSLSTKVKGSLNPEDVVQDAFLIVLSKSDDFLEDLKQRGKLKTYILSTIYYTTKYYNSKHNLDKRKGEKVLELKDYILNGICEIDATEQIEKEKLVSNAVNNLPLEYKTIMYEYALYRSYRKVAQAVGINYGVVKRIVDFCKNEIKKQV